ncbi:MAG: hypothetical protein KA163_07210 [Bacteroidia bacterium]|nr:hypothetical protein [Bacteroidia bacterium]
MNSKEVNKLEIHYYLNDDSHAIDAYIRHKCDAEILAIIKELISEFGGNIDVLNEIPSEGGWKDFVKIIKKNKDVLQIGIGTATLIVMILQAIFTNTNTADPDLIKKQRESLNLDVELKKLSIEKIKRELEEGKKPEDVLKDSIKIFSQSLKTVKRRSNFYTILRDYPEVNQFSSTTYLDDKVAGKESIVERKDFQKFILNSDELSIIEDDTAIIEIVAPVLGYGQYNWRGFYKNDSISFSMEDEKFQQSISNKEVSFQKGYFMLCLLEYKRRLNDKGEIEGYDYSVPIVIGQVIGETITETPQGKRYKRIKKLLENQLDIDFENED